MHFDDIAPDTPWQPGSAARHNEINRLLRAGEAAAAPAPSAVRNFTADVRNDSAGTIPAYHAVKLGDPVSRPADALPGWRVSAATDPLAPWGVTTGAIAPGCWGRAVLQGIALAAPATDGEGNCPRIAVGENMLPAADGLVAGAVGAQVLAPPTATRPAVVRFGSWQKPYSGYFAVRCVSWRPLKFKVENGRSPYADFCGNTEFPGAVTIPVAEVTLPSGWGAGDVYLVISYTRNASGVPHYSADIRVAGSKPTGDLFAFHLARIYPSGLVEQTGYDGAIAMPGWVL